MPSQASVEAPSALTDRPDLGPGAPFPDLELPDHNAVLRRLSELAEGDPMVLVFFRGWWCPKEQTFFRGLARLQDEMEVAYDRFLHHARG